MEAGSRRTNQRQVAAYLDSKASVDLLASRPSSDRNPYHHDLHGRPVLLVLLATASDHHDLPTADLPMASEVDRTIQAAPSSSRDLLEATSLQEASSFGQAACLHDQSPCLVLHAARTLVVEAVVEVAPHQPRPPLVRQAVGHQAV